METLTKYFGVNNPVDFTPTIPEPAGQLYHYMESRNYIGLHRKLVHALSNPNIDDTAWISANYDIVETIAETLGFKNPDFLHGIPIDIATDLASKLEWRIKTVIEPVLECDYPENFNHVEVFGVVPVSYYSESTQEYLLKKYSWLKQQGQPITGSFVNDSHSDLGWC